MIGPLDSALLHQLCIHEGVKPKPYTDTKGQITIGVGHNLSSKGLTTRQLLSLLADDVTETISHLEQTYPWFEDLDDVRQRVVIDMCFNLGPEGFAKFQRTIDAIKAGQWREAAGFMLRSVWAGEVGDRAVRLSQMLSDGQDRTSTLPSPLGTPTIAP